MKIMWVGILRVLEQFTVGKIIIGEQGEVSEQYEKFCEITKEKKIQTIVVKKGDIVNIEKDIKIRILFPDTDFIADNILNNNSLVVKFEYKDFKMLFTGDIEEVAESKLINMYPKGELKANILKVPHHRF